MTLRISVDNGRAMKGFDGWPGVGPGSFLASFMRPDIENFEVQYEATETLRKTMKTKQG
jgi:hypothetical protein